MSVISLEEFKNKKRLRSLRRTGNFSNNLSKVSDNLYNSEAIKINNALGILLKENSYNSVVSLLFSFGEKYKIFGLRNKYRSISMIFIIHQEFERISFIRKKYRSAYDNYVLDEILKNMVDIINDIDHSIKFIASLPSYSIDERILLIDSKLKDILIYFSTV